MSGTKDVELKLKNELPREKVPSNVLESGFMTLPRELKIRPLLNLMRSPDASVLLELTVTPEASIVMV